jgi:hypothetical protein
MSEQDPTQKVINAFGTALMMTIARLAALTVEKGMLEYRLSVLENEVTTDLDTMKRVVIARAADIFDGYDFLDDVLAPGDNIFLQKSRFMEHMYAAAGVTPPANPPHSAATKTGLFRQAAEGSLTGIETELYAQHLGLFSATEHEELVAAVDALRGRLSNPDLTPAETGNLMEEAYSLLAETAAKIGERKRR